jgi:hypothetical protein
MRSEAFTKPVGIRSDELDDDVTPPAIGISLKRGAGDHGGKEGSGEKNGG